jgi:hypothetical protein
MQLTNNEYNQIMESKEFEDWEDSIKRLIDYIVDVMDRKSPENEKDIISEDIFVNLFICSLNLQDGIKK